MDHSSSSYMIVVILFYCCLFFPLTQAILLRFDPSQNIVVQVSIWEPIIFENCVPTDRILSCRNEITSCDQCDAYTPDFSCGIHKPGRLSSFQSSKAIGAQEWLFHICWERLDGSRQLIQLENKGLFETLAGRSLQKKGKATSSPSSSPTTFSTTEPTTSSNSPSSAHTISPSKFSTVSPSRSLILFCYICVFLVS